MDFIGFSQIRVLSLTAIGMRASSRPADVGSRRLQVARIPVLRDSNTCAVWRCLRIRTVRQRVVAGDGLLSLRIETSGVSILNRPVRAMSNAANGAKTRPGSVRSSLPRDCLRWLMRARLPDSGNGSGRMTLWRCTLAAHMASPVTAAAVKRLQWRTGNQGNEVTSPWSCRSSAPPCHAPE